MNGMNEMLLNHFTITWQNANQDVRTISSGLHIRQRRVGFADHGVAPLPEGKLPLLLND